MYRSWGSLIIVTHIVQSKLPLLIPRILDWSDDPSIAIGTEYIIQEHVAGMLLMVVLYFSDGPLRSHKRILFEQGFCIGPYCSPVFWSQSPDELDLYGGPSPNCGEDLTSYCRGLIETGFSRLPKDESVARKYPAHQGSIQEHIRLLQISQKMIMELAKDKRIQSAAVPAMLHPDLHKRNIYPAFVYANETPDFAASPEPEENTFESQKNDHKNPDRKEQAWKDALLGPTLFRLFHCCYTTWRDSAPAVHQELVELSARGTELGLQGLCPYSPTEEELKEHARDYEDVSAVQNLKLWLRKSLNTSSDGWVPSDVWDAARDAHRAVYDEWIQTARESEVRGESLTVDKAERLWPFDATSR
ncbi:uncharacterized protein BO97DRAFT_456550 [Aspergillus homomorphus CBS 101889]|uniref:Aminoglycoside phosphotransferase domain-containing protein n=1 Tax=Aspergillus homomorphus (strain CBS 101889) TaxID=1450537 RepID=A0A395HU62_ASPHC|nr:hypothetical protein BO97DRAFT_456550 [Aspergillus homomorphus CBS 101889]RAL10368.1 hypothetical protein BO97DRAFT_456550 [Aspergillus homomorphus CBS 101889]